VDEQPQDQQAQNAPAEPQEPVAPTPPVEEPTQPQEASQEANADSPPEAPAEPTPEEAKPSRAERRIRQLSEKVKQASQPNQPVVQQNQSPQFPNYQEGQEISPQQLQQDVVQTADAIADMRVQQRLGHFQAVNNFERDQDAVPQKFAELNPDNAAFTPELDEAIALDYQERAFKVVGYDQQGQPITQLDPSVRLADIAERHVRSARAYAAKTSADMKTAVANAADTMAPRPGGQKPASKSFSDLSIQEMEQRLGTAPRH
jgi:hypothetical protein